jgi:hypothetical protein
MPMASISWLAAGGSFGGKFTGFASILLLFIVKFDGGMMGRLFDTPESRMITSNSMGLR